MTKHVMSIGQAFTSDLWDVSCTCGLDLSGYETRADAVADWQHHMESLANTEDA